MKLNLNVAVALALSSSMLTLAVPLPGWNDGVAKAASEVSSHLRDVGSSMTRETESFTHHNRPKYPSDDYYPGYYNSPHGNLQGQSVGAQAYHQPYGAYDPHNRPNYGYEQPASPVRSEGASTYDTADYELMSQHSSRASSPGRETTHRPSKPYRPFEYEGPQPTQYYSPPEQHNAAPVGNPYERKHVTSAPPTYGRDPQAALSNEEFMPSVMYHHYPPPGAYPYGPPGRQLKPDEH